MSFGLIDDDDTESLNKEFPQVVEVEEFDSLTLTTEALFITPRKLSFTSPSNPVKTRLLKRNAGSEKNVETDDVDADQYLVRHIAQIN